MRFLVAVLVVMGGARASAEDGGSRAARIHMQAAVAYYDEAKYDDAAKEMEAAYRMKPLPDLQYNLAQCYERLGRLEDAARAYERYLAEKSGAEDRAAVQARIANLRAREKVPPPPTEKVVFKTIVVYREAPPPPGRAARWTAYGLAALSVGALAAGIATAVLSARARDDVRSLANVADPPLFEGRPQAAQERFETMAIVSGVSFGLAVLSAGGAIGLHLLGNKIDREAKERESQVSISPSLSTHGAGLLVRGSF